MNDEDRKYLTLAMSECWHKHVEAWITDYICRDIVEIYLRMLGNLSPAPSTRRRISLRYGTGHRSRSGGTTM